MRFANDLQASTVGNNALIKKTKPIPMTRFRHCKKTYHQIPPTKTTFHTTSTQKTRTTQPFGRESFQLGGWFHPGNHRSGRGGRGCTEAAGGVSSIATCGHVASMGCLEWLYGFSRECTDWLEIGEDN